MTKRKKRKPRSITNIDVVMTTEMAGYKRILLRILRKYRDGFSARFRETGSRPSSRYLSRKACEKVYSSNPEWAKARISGYSTVRLMSPSANGTYSFNSDRGVASINPHCTLFVGDGTTLRGGADLRRHPQDQLDPLGDRQGEHAGLLGEDRIYNPYVKAAIRSSFQTGHIDVTEALELNPGWNIELRRALVLYMLVWLATSGGLPGEKNLYRHLCEDCVGARPIQTYNNSNWWIAVNSVMQGQRFRRLSTTDWNACLELVRKDRFGDRLYGRGWFEYHTDDEGLKALISDYYGGH